VGKEVFGMLYCVGKNLYTLVKIFLEAGDLKRTLMNKILLWQLEDLSWSRNTRLLSNRNVHYRVHKNT
jgi:hypothetical protein